MEPSVEELCRRAKAGDLEAATRLLTCFYARVYAYFRRLIPSDQDAADLTQKTFCKVWSALASFQGRSSVATWILGIAHHVYADWCRQRRPVMDAGQEWWAESSSESPSPFELAADLDLARRLYGLVEQLEEPLRQTVHLHYYQGLSLSETAEVLETATSTVKYRLRAARDWLRSRLEEPSQSLKRGGL